MLVNKLISVIIPVKNGAATLDRCLRSLRQQTIGKSLQIIILDSMSIDTSREIAAMYDTIIIDIPNGTFNHGLTRNIGFQHAKGALLYYTVQDAWIAENTMLARMVNHFTDNQVMGVTGMQAIAHERDKNPALWFKRITEPLIQTFQFLPDKFNELTLQQRFQTIGWDNVNSMYKKEALELIPFNNTNYAEDKFWCVDALAQGYKLIFDPSILVYHYHHLTFNYTFKDKFITSYYFYKHFQVLPAFPSFINNVIKRFYTLYKRKHISLSNKFYWSCHNVSQYLGYFFSILLFRTLKEIGGEKLMKKVYLKICNNVPMGRQKL